MFSRFARHIGSHGTYLSLCKRMGRVPFPVQVPPFGTIGTLAEVHSLHDNFVIGEIRDPQFEAALSAQSAPVIIDCGINVGITVRWWLHLNPATRVLGFDMMHEAHEFTVARLGSLSKAYQPFSVLLADREGLPQECRFDDPLCGGNRISTEGAGHQARKFVTTTLDVCLQDRPTAPVFLLKMDIEGSGHLALAGGIEVLRRTQHVVIEFHSPAELAESNTLLARLGFKLRNFKSRNVWYGR
jgi:FkbM family methyltransferase